MGEETGIFSNRIGGDDGGGVCWKNGFGRDGVSMYAFVFSGWSLK